MDLLLLIGFLGIICGFLSGLLGIGGGIIMAPLLLYIPPLLGFETISMRTVAGLTIVQGLVACIAGTIAHNRFNFVSGKLASWMGISIFAASLFGGAAANYVDNRILLFIFGCLAITAATLMFLQKKQDQETPDIKTLEFDRWRAITTSGSVGLLGGMVG